MDEISFGEVWRSLSRRRWLLLATTLAGAMFAGAVVLLMTPVYRAEALLAPVQETSSESLSVASGRFGGLAALAGIDLGTGSGDREEAVALLRSRVLAIAFIEDNDLLPVLFEEEWDAGADSWQSADSDDAPTLWEGYRRFDEDIRTVSVDPRTGLVTLAIEWTDPAVAAAWARQLVERVNAETRARAIREAERSLAYLNTQLQKTDVVELRQAIYGLVENQTKQMMLANVREDYAFKVIDPPTAPDADDPIRPLPALTLLLGSLAGLVLGVLAALLAGSRTGFSGVPESQGR